MISPTSNVGNLTNVVYTIINDHISDALVVDSASKVYPLSISTGMSLYRPEESCRESDMIFPTSPYFLRLLEARWLLIRALKGVLISAWMGSVLLRSKENARTVLFRKDVPSLKRCSLSQKM